MYFRDNKNMDRSLGVDIIKCDDGFGFKNNVGRDFFVYYFAEKTIVHF